MKNSIRVRVPGTTANIGPGFDSLGIALQIYNYVDVRLTRKQGVSLGRSIAASQRVGARAMISEAAIGFFRASGCDPLGVEVDICGDVPAARGLGSSVTLRMGVVAGLNELVHRPLSRARVLDVVAELEGHPDNAAPAIYGGFAVSGIFQGQVSCIVRKLPAALKFVTLIPDFEVETKKARKLLPKSLPFHDAVTNVNRVALLVAAFCDGDFGRVGNFLEDRLHQPYRAKLIPQLFSVLNAAKIAGAIGGWLSGSGSTIIALTLEDPKAVENAMRFVMERSGAHCEVKILAADTHGLRFKKI